jgi:hypothetical protein
MVRLLMELKTGFGVFEEATPIRKSPQAEFRYVTDV